MNDEESLSEELTTSAGQFARLAMQMNVRFVFAESCTAGLLCSELARSPGISSYLCGSFATYRNDSKAHWLNVSRDDLESESIGPVSETVAVQMARGALLATPEADVAISVTGHLGPEAPVSLDGIAFTSIFWRQPESWDVKMLRLKTNCDPSSQLRRVRQIEAALQVLHIAIAEVKRRSDQ